MRWDVKAVKYPVMYNEPALNTLLPVITQLRGISPIWRLSQLVPDVGGIWMSPEPSEQ